jgi:peptidoglycan/LPS O-acetylase OafA/YrhL
VVFLHVQWPNHVTSTRFVNNGYLAVDLFFILSGFVIAANYSTSIVDLRAALRFMTLRFFRLYPLHLATLACFVGLECLKVVAARAAGIMPEHQPFTGGQSVLPCLANVFLIHGLGWMRTWGFNGPSWSISCEFYVYALVAAASLFGLTRRPIYLIGAAVATAVAYAAIAWERGTLDVVLDLGIVRCIAGFFWGMLIFRFSGWLRSQSPTCITKYQISVAVAVLVTLATVSGPTVLMIIPLFVVLVALLLLDRGPVAQVLMSKPAQYLGRISYSIYMIHYCVIVCVLMFLKRVFPISYKEINPWIGDLIVVVLIGMVVALASGTYAYIEEPGRLFGRRLLQQSGRAHVRVSVASQTSAQC